MKNICATLNGRDFYFIEPCTTFNVRLSQYNFRNFLPEFYDIFFAQ